MTIDLYCKCGASIQGATPDQVADWRKSHVGEDHGDCPVCLDGAQNPSWHAVDDEGNFSCARCGRPSLLEGAAK